LVGVADKVGVLHYLVPLIKVAKDDEAVAKGALCGAYTEIELVVRGLAVFLRKHSLVRRPSGECVLHGSAGAVAGRLGVKYPGRISERGRANTGRCGKRRVRTPRAFADANQLYRVVDG
jgi:hypothetical protein